MLQNETTFEPELVNIAEYLNTQYKEEMFANILEATKALNETWVKQVREQEILL